MYKSTYNSSDLRCRTAPKTSRLSKVHPVAEAGLSFSEQKPYICQGFPTREIPSTSLIKSGNHENHLEKRKWHKIQGTKQAIKNLIMVFCIMFDIGILCPFLGWIILSHGQMLHVERGKPIVFLVCNPAPQRQGQTYFLMGPKVNQKKKELTTQETSWKWIHWIHHVWVLLLTSFGIL